MDQDNHKITVALDMDTTFLGGHCALEIIPIVGVYYGSKNPRTDSR
jgi:hypothetical protein